MISKNNRHILLIAIIISTITIGCSSAPKVYYKNNFQAQGINPSLSGRIEGWSDENITAWLTFNYTGDYDSAALFLDNQKVTTVGEFPFKAEYDITKLSSPATHVYSGYVWTTDTVLSASLLFNFSH